MQKLITIGEEAFPLGYNDKLEPDRLGPEYCSLIQNGFLDNNIIQERTGYSLAGNDTGEATPNLLLHPHEVTSGTQLLKINNNATNTLANLFYWTGSGNWVKVTSLTFTASLPCQAVTANGYTYITNGTDTVKRWDSSTNTLTNISAIPITMDLVWFHNFLWALNASSYKNRAFFSNIGDPETFQPANYIDINPDDNDYIVAGVSFQDELLIGKRHSIVGYQGWSELTFTTSATNARLSTHGISAANSFISTGKDIHFLSFNGNIPHVKTLSQVLYSGLEYTGLLTDPIEGTMKVLSLGQLSKACQVFDGRKVWYFMPNGSSTYNDLAITYDTVTKGFSKHTGIYAAGACLSAVSGRDRVYFADSRNSKVYLFDGGNSDNGAAIDFQYISRRFSPDPKRFFKWKYLFISLRTGAAGNMLVYCSPDDYDFDLQETIPLTQTNSSFPYVFSFGLGSTTQYTERIELPYGVHQKMRLKLAKNDANARATVLDYDFMGYQKPVRDMP